MFKTAQAAGLNPQLEQRHLIEESNNRPGDVFIPDWRGRPTAFDYAVTSPMCKTHLPYSSKQTGAALERTKAGKIRKHGAQCTRNGIRFVPVVFETFGGLDSDATFHLRHIAIKSAARSSRPSSNAVTHFFQRQSVICQRYCSAMITARAPQHPADIIGP